MVQYESHEDDETRGTIPMLDVLLITLLYFLLTASVTVGKMNMPVPPSAAPEAITTQPIVLEVDIQGGMKLEGVRYGPTDLEKELNQRKPTAVLVAAHREAPIRHVVAARDLLVRARVPRYDLAIIRDPN